LVKSVSIPEGLYTELERAGILLAYVSGRKEPYTVEEMLVMAAEKSIAHMNTNHEDLKSTVYIPASLSLLSGEGKLQTIIDKYIKKQNFRIKAIQKATNLPNATLYTIASGERMPSVDTLFKLLPALGFPSLDELFTR